MSEQRFRLEIHPDDRQKWRDMTGRTEEDESMPPVRSRAGLDYMLDSARRNGVRVLRHWQVGGGS